MPNKAYAKRTDHQALSSVVSGDQALTLKGFIFHNCAHVPRISHKTEMRLITVKIT